MYCFTYNAVDYTDPPTFSPTSLDSWKRSLSRRSCVSNVSSFLVTLNPHLHYSYGSRIGTLRLLVGLHGNQRFGYGFTFRPTEFSDFRLMLDEPEVRIVTQQLASATAYLHEKGIVHRDLKPEARSSILDENPYIG